MVFGRRQACCIIGALLMVTAGAPAPRAQENETKEPDLEEKVEILAGEVARLREQMNIPATDDELQGRYGMGPAASKVYGVSQGISFGGYGEFYFAAPISNTEETGAVRTADFLRLIGYVGYKFSDSIVMNAEIEYEHATTGANWNGENGEVSVEFAYLDFLLDPAFNIRTGNVLVPMGFINLMHEPTTFLGTTRPVTEQRIIPTTWRELGIGAHGGGDRLAWSAYAINGFNGEAFSSTGVRSGRQKGNRAIWEDVGAVAAVDWTHTASDGAFRLGASAYYGGADQGIVTDSTGAALDVSNSIYEAHAEFRRGGLRARALVAMSHVENAGELSWALFGDGTTLSSQVPEDQLGWYAEAGYDVAPLLWSGAGFTLTPWIRYERFNLQDGVDSLTGLDANPALDGTLVTVGLESKPHPNVVLKLDALFPSNEADAPVSNEIRLGAGFIY